MPLVRKGPSTGFFYIYMPYLWVHGSHLCDNVLSSRRTTIHSSCMAQYINNRWCNLRHVAVKETICRKDVELLAVSLQTYYMPREFSCTIVVCVYVLPRAFRTQPLLSFILQFQGSKLNTHTDAFSVIFDI